MHKTILCGFQQIEGLSFFRSSNLEKGRKLFDAGHIDAVKEETTPKWSKITAKCLSQVSVNKVYSITITLSRDRYLISASCSCKAGVTGKCKHAAALVIYVNEYNDPSKTNQKQSWGIPKAKEGYSKGKKLSRLFPFEKHNSAVPKYPLSLVMEAFPDIKCPLFAAWKAQEKTADESACSTTINDLVDTVCRNEILEAVSSIYASPAIDDFCGYGSALNGDKIILRRTKLNLSSDLQNFYDQTIKISAPEMINYALLTIQQSRCPLWKSLRACRLSSSICHKIVTRTADFDGLAHSILNANFSGNDATKYGLKLEGAAKSWFGYKNQKPILNCGVIISAELPWLCCSPDALYDDSGIKLLEIKCPISRKGQKITNNIISYVKYIVHDGKTFILKRNHSYYTQVQVAMFVTKTSECSFLVYSSVDKLVIKVQRDEPFLAEYIPKLYHFYFNHLLPIVQNNKLE